MATTSLCSCCASSASACTAAISIERVMVVAPASSAPRKINGKHRTLLTDSDNRFGQWPALHLAALRAHVPEGFPALDWRARKSAAAAPSVEPASASTPCRQTSREKYRRLQ